MLGVEVSGHELAALVAELVPDAVSELDVPRQVLVGDLYGAHRAPLLRHQAVPACNISRSAGESRDSTQLLAAVSNLSISIYLSVFICLRFLDYLNVRLSDTSSQWRPCRNLKAKS